MMKLLSVIKNALLLLVVLAASGNSQTRKPVCALLPFQNKSTFVSDSWRLEREIPLAFSDSLINSGLFEIIEMSLVEMTLEEFHVRPYTALTPELLTKIASTLQADYLIFGQILNFELGRTTIGDPMMAGFESYKAEMTVAFSIFNRVDGVIFDSYSCRSEISQKDLGVTFVGRPSKNYVSFDELDEMKFNSSEFKATILGAGLKDLVGRFVSQVLKQIPGADASQISVNKEDFFEAMIVLRRNDEVYFNAGFAEKVSAASEYAVYTQGDSIIHPESGRMLGFTDKPIGKLKVILVKDNHLSLARIMEEVETIKVKDKVWIEKK